MLASVLNTVLDWQKKQELKKYKSCVELKLMQEIKNTINPNNIMNPGKVLWKSEQ